jgi:predicted CXXCH cytochrome family protein
MRVRQTILLSVLIVAVAAGIAVFSGQASSEEGCVNGKCHAGLLSVKTVHPVASMCDSCHQSVSTPHPQKNKQTFKLLQEPPDLCYGCHQAFGTKKDVHPPVKGGMCLSCHNPHGSDEPRMLTQPLKDLCLTCHPDKVNHKFLHGPASTGDCTICHSPHESDNSTLLLEDQPKLCFGCHTDMEAVMKKKDVHPAVLSGCTSCHNPHGSEFKRLLSAEGANLCFQCHPQIQETVEKAKIIHAPVLSEQGCVSCHSPHAADADKLLARPGKELCLGCHTDIIKKGDTMLHGPIRDGFCTPCHNPHGSPNNYLLLGEFPDDLYAPYTDKEYGLCFTCHNRDLLRFPDTSFATGFRDGDRNLHYLHVNRKEKGRSCIACHAIHSGKNPKMIADRVPFGKWKYPLNYVKTDTGGSCQPGCHKKLSYDRKTPGQPQLKPPPQQK